MTQASNLRPAEVWGHEVGQHISEPIRLLYESVLFHKFEKYDAICELPSGKVIVAHAWQLKFTDREKP